MNYLSIENTFKAIAFSLVVVLTACSSGGSDDPPIVVIDNELPNPNLIKKSEAIDFTQIKLYDGHVKVNDGSLNELNVSDLNSGDLITIDVEFEVTGDLEDYSLAAQLVPIDIFNRLNSGNTIGEVINEDIKS